MGKEKNGLTRRVVELFTKPVVLKPVDIVERAGKAVARFSKGKCSCSPEDLQKRIQSKAYELYVKRGAVPGHSEADWAEAERLVKAELGI